MSTSQALAVVREAIMVAAKIAAPILLLSMLVGIIISIFQAATQIHEQTITFVPKLILVFVVLIVGGSWMINTLVDFSGSVFGLMLY